MRKLLTIVITLLCTSAFVSAQQDSSKKEVDYKPRVEGIIKVKFEESLYNGNARFDVRNSRFGVRGNVAKNMKYRMQVEFNNEGKLSVLDAYVSYHMPIVSISLGQQRYAFNSNLARNPMQNIFANRTFVSKYTTTYRDTSGNVRTLGSRDIGGLLTFDLKNWLPLRLKAGVFNGAGINNPEWQNNNLNLSLKAEYGNKKGFQAAASYYFGENPYKQDFHMWGGELRYVGKNFTVDSEITQRTFKLDGNHTLTAAFAQGFYKINLKPNAFAHYIAPTLRYDYMDNGMYSGALDDEFDAQRISIGTNFGIASKIFKGEIRINFEKYILAKNPTAIHPEQLLHDKFTLEMVVAF